MAITETIFNYKGQYFMKTTTGNHENKQDATYNGILKCYASERHCGGIHTLFPILKLFSLKKH